MRRELEFPLKGARSYVHGTSLLSGIVKVARAEGCLAGHMDISFKRMVENTLCVVERRSPRALDAVTAQLKADDGSRLQLCINPADTIGAIQREEYDETAVCRNSVLRDRSIVLDDAEHDDSIELIVSLCKKMHCEIIDSSKKWVFARYIGVFPLPPIRQVEITITKQIGVRLTCNDVVVSGEKIGEVFFSC